MRARTYKYARRKKGGERGGKEHTRCCGPVGRDINNFDFMKKVCKIALQNFSDAVLYASYQCEKIYHKKNSSFLKKNN